MSKRESKKDLILCCGLDIMKTKGYNGTSVKDIVDAANVPKGSFYNYFESKEHFAIEALEKVAYENTEFSRTTLGNSALPPMERLQRFFTEATKSACTAEFRVGCFLGNMCQEMSDSNDLIRTKVHTILQAQTHAFATVLDDAKACGQLRASADSMLLAEFIFNAWEGALMRTKASRCRTPLDAFIRVLPNVIY